MSENILYIGEKEFEQTVLKGGKVVVDFYSTDCPPCEALAAKFEPLSRLYGNDITFVKIFRQENRALAESLGVVSSPTILFYDGGRRVGDVLRGAVKRAELTENLDKLLPEERVRELHRSVQRSESEWDVMIVGGGPAGLAAAVYSAQAQLKTVLVDRNLPGGQVSTTHQVSNYPGFVDAQPGYMLMHAMSEQAVKAGCEYRVAVDLSRVDLDAKEIEIDGIETLRAKKIIVAVGSSPNPLGIPGEEEYRGRGISYCATCDAKYYEGRSVIVIGGGNTAVEESLFIARFASHITVVHQFAELQANKLAQKKAFDEPKIEFMFRHEPRRFVKNDDGGMDVAVENLADGTLSTLTADGVFVFAGMKPNIQALNHRFDLDERGYIAVDAVMRTSTPDVFAVGDVASKPYRQITVAVAEGTVAAIQAAKELG